MKDPRLIIKNKPLDIELCELLDEKQTDFVVLCADGEIVHFYGTPFDSPRERESIESFVHHLNDPSPKSWWPSFFTVWRDRFEKHYNLPPETTAETFRPKFSWAISRVCVGYSEYLHAAIGLFDRLGDRIGAWDFQRKEDGKYDARLYCGEASFMKGFRATGKDPAQVIARVVRDFLVYWRTLHPPVTPEEEALVAQCIEIIRQERRASTPLFQRRLHLGYTKTRRIMDILEERGHVGPLNPEKGRQILIPLEEVPA